MNAGVVQRVDVNGKSLRVLRGFGGAGDGTEIEARGVVGTHRRFVICIIVVDKCDAFYGICCIVQFAENAEQVCCNGLIADNFSQLSLTLRVAMKHPQLAQ